MSEPHRSDPILQALAALPRVEPSAAHAESTRLRCRSKLAQKSLPPSPLVFEPAAVSVACATYAWELARLAAILSR